MEKAIIEFGGDRARVGRGGKQKVKTGTVKKLKIFLAAVIYFLILPFVFSQQIINNPEKPAGRKAGRVIKTRRIWQIDDSQGVF